MPEAEFRTRPDHFIGQCLQPCTQRSELTVIRHCFRTMLDQLSCLFIIRRSKSMVNGVARETMLLIPGARAPVKFRSQIRLPEQQAMAQRFSEELVVAIPLSLSIQRREE